jgi:hypothetical protein
MTEMEKQESVAKVKCPNQPCEGTMVIQAAGNQGMVCLRCGGFIPAEKLGLDENLKVKQGV